MESSEVLLTGLDTFADVFNAVPADGWDAPTPCQQWTLRHVAGHILLGTDATLALLGGGEFDWSAAGDPADRAGVDPVVLFASAASSVRTGLAGADLDTPMETPMGPMTMGQRIGFMAMDLHMHSWDVSKAVGAPIDLAPEVMAFAHAVMDPLPESAMRSDRVFGPEVTPPADATPTEAFVAWTGRQPR